MWSGVDRSSSYRYIIHRGDSSHRDVLLLMLLLLCGFDEESIVLAEFEVFIVGSETEPEGGAASMKTQDYCRLAIGRFASPHTTHLIVFQELPVNAGVVLLNRQC